MGMKYKSFRKDIFPTRIAQYELGRNFDARELRQINKYLSETTRNLGNVTSKNTEVLRNRNLSSLNKFAKWAIDDYAKSHLHISNTEFRITQSWLNRCEKGQWHHAHRHPNSVFSAVLYIESDPSDKIHFIRDETFVRLSFERDVFDEASSLTWWMPASKGTMLVFPSDLTHKVEPTTSNERISLSLNTWPIAPFGSKGGLIRVT